VARGAIVSWLLSGTAGSFVALSGGGATRPLARLAAYSASKAAVVRFVETVAHEYTDAGLRFNALAPGALPGRMREQQRASGLPVAETDTTREAAACAVWLLSDASRHVNGKLVSAPWDPWPLTETLGDDQLVLRRTEL
jgi:NAD(P)-dependent dehydrogenase (short-subunit alcohol dehydrogenase family)